MNDDADHDELKLLEAHPQVIARLLFEQMPMGLVFLSPDLRILQYNATWAGYLQRYSPDIFHRLQPNIPYFDLLPHDSLRPLINAALKGTTVHEPTLRLKTSDAPSYWDITAAPILQGKRVIGILLVGTDVTEKYHAQQSLLVALDELQRSHEVIEQRVDERTRELKTLMTVQQALTSSLNLNEVLQVIAREARHLTHTDIGCVFLPDEDELVLAVLSSHHPINIAPGYRISLTESITGTAFRLGQTQLVPEITAHSHVDPNALTKAGLRSILSVPLISGTRVIGVLSVGNKVEGTLTEDDERLLLMMIPSAVVALENVQVYEQASETAVAAERGRLARDLHDSVTQTLFSASLTAEVLPRIWSRNPQEGIVRLEKLRGLTRGALAEMRTLLLELRPTALAEMPLTDLLRQLAEGIAARTRIDITVSARGEQDPMTDIKIALYRIAQEALNNVAKHARAQHAAITLEQSAHHITLVIKDDGIGFDLESARANQLGLRIMAERAEAIQAQFDIKTTSGQGSQVTVSWSEKE